MRSTKYVMKKFIVGVCVRILLTTGIAHAARLYSLPGSGGAPSGSAPRIGPFDSRRNIAVDIQSVKKMVQQLAVRQNQMTQTLGLLIVKAC